MTAEEKAMACNNTLDVVILMDGSGSMGQRGWDAQMVATKTIVSAFKISENADGESKAAVSVILYSGPRTWRGVRKCFRRSRDPVNMENDCKIKTVTHFSRNLKQVTQKIEGLTWPKGSTLTSLALMTAKSELSLGRK